MRTLIIVDSVRDWPLKFEGVELVTAWNYLADPAYADMEGVRIFNLCRSYRYQSTGYYVSLLAAARGHKPFPSVTTIQDIKQQSIIRIYSEDLEEMIQRHFSSLKSDEFTLSVYFGKNLAKRYDRLSQRLFSFFQVPFLQADFVRSRKTRRWYLRGIEPVGAKDIPEEHRRFVIEVARDFFGRRRITGRRKVRPRYDLAILCNTEEEEPPSDERAIHLFSKAAESLGIEAELIGREDYGRVAEFDALFIRETTSVNHHTYRFARRAAAEGLVVVDDPESILKCTNKVFLAELLNRHSIPVPRTVIVHRDNMKTVPGVLGLPVILKRPDSSFSQGVVKAETDEQYLHWADRMLERSEMIIAQEFVPTEYDWRIGIFDRRPLFLCKYFMAREHWQIIKRDSAGAKMEDGMWETVPVQEAPKGLVNLALKSANLIGDGLYGVDMKQVGQKFYIVEINDNPNVESGVEDSIAGAALYKTIMEVFLQRIEDQKKRK